MWLEIVEHCSDRRKVVAYKGQIYSKQLPILSYMLRIFVTGVKESYSHTDEYLGNCSLQSKNLKTFKFSTVDLESGQKY